MKEDKRSEGDSIFNAMGRSASTSCEERMSIVEY